MQQFLVGEAPFNRCTQSPRQGKEQQTNSWEKQGERLFVCVMKLEIHEINSKNLENMKTEKEIFMDSVYNSLPQRKWEKRGDYKKRVSDKFNWDQAREKAFFYESGTARPRKNEYDILNELMLEASDTVSRVRALANETLSRGERLKDEEREQWEHIYQQLIQMRGSLRTAD